MSSSGEGTAILKIKLSSLSCAGTSEISEETIHFFLGGLLIPFTSCFYVLATSLKLWYVDREWALGLIPSYIIHN